MFNEVDVEKLKAHSYNENIYGTEKLPDDFLNSIRMLGVLVPLTIKNNGTIISGHRRWRAAKILGLKTVPVQLVDYDSELDEQEAIIAFNKQREKTFSQKMREAEEIEIIERKRAKERQAHGETAPGRTLPDMLPEASKGETRDKVADAVGFGSGRTYDRARKVWKTAKEGNEKAQQIVSRLDKKQITIHKAYKEVCKQKKRDEKRAYQEEPELLSSSIEIELGDFRERLQHIGEQSVDLIFTDPPYHEKYLHLWEDLAIEALRTLKPDGFLLAYSGQNCLVQVFEILNRHLVYYWVAAVEHTHGQLRFWHKKVWNSWKPILIFAASKESKPVNWFSDLQRKGDKEAKLYHDWGQPLEEAKYFIEHFCPPHGFVVDPMCGSGTIPLAAYLTGRKSLGIDIEAESVYTARKRIREERATTEHD